MDEELTNEAAERIGEYTIKGGKKAILSDLLERGGIVRKEIEQNSGRKKGCERVNYFFPDGGYATFDPARLKIFNKLKLEKSPNIL